MIGTRDKTGETPYRAKTIRASFGALFANHDYYNHAYIVREVSTDENTVRVNRRRSSINLHTKTASLGAALLYHVLSLKIKS